MKIPQIATEEAIRAAQAVGIPVVVIQSSTSESNTEKPVPVMTPEEKTLEDELIAFGKDYIELKSAYDKAKVSLDFKKELILDRIQRAGGKFHAGGIDITYTVGTPKKTLDSKKVQEAFKEQLTDEFFKESPNTRLTVKEYTEVSDEEITAPEEQ